MAWPAALSAAVSGSSAAGGGLLSANMNRWMANDTRKHNEKMYWLSEKREEDKWNWQNAYNEKMWNMQNKYNEDRWHELNNYNTPAAMMQRFKDAGLNPNLIYGQSNSGAPVTSAQFGKSDMGSGKVGNASYTPADIDLGGGAFVQSMLQSEMNKVQVDNVKAQTAYTNQQTGNEALRAIGIDVDNQLKSQGKSKGAIELHNARQYSGQILKATLDKTIADVNKTVDDNSRAWQQNASSLREAATRISKMNSEKLGQDQRNKIEAFENDLKRKGIYPNSHVYWKLGLIFLKKLGFDIESEMPQQNVWDGTPDKSEETNLYDYGKD